MVIVRRYSGWERLHVNVMTDTPGTDRRLACFMPHSQSVISPLHELIVLYVQQIRTTMPNVWFAMVELRLENEDVLVLPCFGDKPKRILENVRASLANTGC